MRITSLALTLILLLPATASAAYIHGPDGEGIQPYARWSDTFDRAAVPPNADITVITGDAALGYCRARNACARPTDCVDLTACHSVRATIWIKYPARADFAHELGHAFDYAMMTDDARALFVSLMGTPGRPWRDPPNSPHEQFAEAFGFCATRGVAPRWVWTYGYNYDPELPRHARVCKLIRRVAFGDSLKGV